MQRLRQEKRLGSQQAKEYLPCGGGTWPDEEEGMYGGAAKESLDFVLLQEGTMEGF